MILPSFFVAGAHAQSTSTQPSTNDTPTPLILQNDLNGLSGVDGQSNVSADGTSSDQQLDADSATASQGVDTTTTTGAVSGAGAVGRQQNVNAVGPTSQADQPAQGSGASPNGASPNEDLFAADGIRAGQFTIRPSIEFLAGYTDNSTASANGEGSAFSDVNSELAIESDFDRHALNLTMSAAYRRFFEGDNDRDLSVNATLTGRYDISEETSVTGTLSYQGAEDDQDGVGADPFDQTFTAGLQGDTRFGRVTTQLRASVAWLFNEDFRDGNGVLVSGEASDSVTTSLAARVGYDSGGAITPFVEGEVTREVFEQRRDANGVDRTVNTYAVRAGIDVDRGEKLSGSASIGYVLSDPEGTGFRSIDGFEANASLLWSPRRLTEVQFDLGTTFDPDPSATNGGDVTYTGNVRVTRDVRENVSAFVEGGLAYQQQDVGADSLTYNAGLGVDYQLNKNVAVAGRYTFQTQTSDNPADEFTSNSVSLGMRLRR